MRSLFDAEDNQQMISRINKLTPDTKPLWGKMNVSQMLTHSQMPLKVAYGNVKLKRGLMGVLFGKIAKKKLVGEKDFSKNLPTDKNFLVKDTPDFGESKSNLAHLVRQFVTAGPEKLSKDPHPFFGKLTTHEWDILMWKHLDHHLRQFGV
jgi:hypothetical protein